MKNVRKMIKIRNFAKAFGIMLALLVFSIIYFVNSQEQQQHQEQQKPEIIKNKIDLLIYKTYYTKVLLPEFDKFLTLCPHLANRINVFRSNKMTNFDAAIIHFFVFDHFYNDYVNSLNWNSKIKRKVVLVFCWEPPYSSIWRVNEYRNAAKYFYLWSITYNKDSFMPRYFGAFIKSKTSTYNEWQIKKNFDSRLPKAACLISNCDRVYTPRLSYINELKKHFNVELYLTCNKKNIPESFRLEILNTVMFFLAFENQHCKNYATEKYYDPLYYGSIPVTMGYGSYKDHIIDGNFINVFDFKNASSLGNYLKYVSQNYTEYKKYFQWKKDWNVVVHPEWTTEVCELCEKILSATEGRPQEDNNFHLLITSHHCYPTDQVSNMLSL